MLSGKTAGMALQEILLILGGFILFSLTLFARTDRACGAETDGAETNTASTCYEVFVYSFCDSNGDGIGDFRGLIEKLDYINDGDEETLSDLGCDMIWLMPVFVSPTYHKYDVTDYLAIDPVYGTLEDFDALVSACHERGVRLILDFPVNHTSWEHPWFTEAAAYLKSMQEGEEPSPEKCPYVDYYNFSREAGNGYAQLEGTDWYYEARFWAGMPDLNLDSEAVREELKAVTDYWMDRGVDGFRLDAVTYYYSEDREASISFCGWLNDTVKDKNPACYLVAEAWTDLGTYSQFYESGIDSMFDFGFSGQEGVIARVAGGKKDALWYGQKLVEEEELFASFGSHVINAPFYTNHDMARSAGYYTRDDGSRHKFAEGLNLLMPGRAFLYYGEELGMKGSGKDENKRAPMYWSEDPNAAGMCSGPPEMDEVKMKYDSAEKQMEDPSSILSYIRRAIRLRKSYPAIAKGRTQIAWSSEKGVCILKREAEGEETVFLAINAEKEAREADLTQLAVQAGSDFILAEGLYTGEEEAKLSEGLLTIPPLGIAVITGA